MLWDMNIINYKQDSNFSHQCEINYYYFIIDMPNYIREYINVLAWSVCITNEIYYCIFFLTNEIGVGGKKRYLISKRFMRINGRMPSNIICMQSLKRICLTIPQNRVELISPFSKIYDEPKILLIFKNWKLYWYAAGDRLVCLLILFD